MVDDKDSACRRRRRDIGVATSTLLSPCRRRDVDVDIVIDVAVVTSQRCHLYVDVATSMSFSVCFRFVFDGGDGDALRATSASGCIDLLGREYPCQMPASRL